jgi:hypothetical protein
MKKISLFPVLSPDWKLSQDYDMFPDRDKRPLLGGWASGYYTGICCICKDEFMGDKRAIQCAPCAYKDGDGSMKIGLDIHGVIDKHWDLYSAIAKAMMSDGNEVHIITGAHYRDVVGEIIGFPRTHFYSIADHHEGIGTEIRYDERGRPWIDEYLWNKSKAEYCALHDINLMIDDTPVYGDYFTTPYCLHVPGD